MYLEKIITVAVSVMMLAASTGQLPKLVLAVRKAQIQLIQETKASKWGQVPLLPSTHTNSNK